MARRKDHLQHAANALFKAQKSLEAAQHETAQVVRGHSRILEQQGTAIASLERQIVELRNHAIRAEVRAGVASKEVAVKYGLSAGRIAQIAPRRQHH
jgi:hypothetical protein